jgi:hypothetical protein
MAINYARLAQVAQRLIDENGRALTITLRPRTPVDLTKPWNGPNIAASASITVTGVIGDDTEVDAKGDLVRNGQKLAYIAALDTDPALIEQYDVLTDGSDRWKIQKVDNVAPGPTRLVYVLTLAS